MAASNDLLFLTSLLVLMSMVPLMATSARPLSNSPIGTGSNSNLVARLNLDEGSSNCWDSMFQLQACSGEVVMFFLNGETYLGHGCCEAIRIIERQCWPALLGTLGFTTEETDVLKGYCDEAHHVPSPPSTTPLSPPPPVDEPPKKTARVPDLEKLMP